MGVYFGFLVMRKLVLFIFFMLSVFANAGSSEKLVSDYLELTYSDGRNGNTAQQKLILICFNTSECTGVDPEVCVDENLEGFQSCDEKDTCYSCSKSVKDYYWKSVEHCFAESTSVRKCFSE